MPQRRLAMHRLPKDQPWKQREGKHLVQKVQERQGRGRYAGLRRHHRQQRPPTVVPAAPHGGECEAEARGSGFVRGGSRTGGHAQAHQAA
eukprot:11435682-Heterocapsa_arctica.AAC.1